MRILFIAPRTNLSQVGPELARVTSGNEISVCDGLVDRSKLELAMRDEEFDVIHFAQHGGRAGLELTDGVIEVGDLVSMLERQKHLSLIVVNACNSAATGIALHNALHVPIVAHDASITDAAALAFSETFYRALKTTKLGDAFQRALRTLQVRYVDEARTPQLINGDMADRGALQKLRGEMLEAYQHFNTRLDTVEATLTTMNDQRGRQLQMIIVGLLAALLVAQFLTPVLNSWLIR